MTDKQISIDKQTPEEEKKKKCCLFCKGTENLWTTTPPICDDCVYGRKKEKCSTY